MGSLRLPPAPDRGSSGRCVAGTLGIEPGEGAWVRLDLTGALLAPIATAMRPGCSPTHADARRRAQELLSRPLLERAAALERQARGHASVAEPWRPLTIREFEVARLIGAGRTNADIAAELAIAPKTVSSHVEHVLGKLDLRRRAEIATWVAQVNHPARRSVAGRVPVVATGNDLDVVSV